MTSSEHEYSHSKCNNVGAEVFENSRRSESHTWNAMPKEKVVLVEKEGCATVVMYTERHTARVCLADGTVITGSNQGVYEVCGFTSVFPNTDNRKETVDKCFPPRCFHPTRGS